ARAARVTVPDYQLSLAIGREGQNARLAARLTGWRIDIRSDAASADGTPAAGGAGHHGSAHAEAAGQTFAVVRGASPVRTCVGCRKRAQASELLRVVAVPHGVDQSGDELISVEPDPARRRPGRGAHLHPDPACLALAERRRAFGRALRV